MGSASKCDENQKRVQNHYLVPTKYACSYDLQPAQTPPKMHPKIYPKRISKLHIPSHQKSIFGEFLVAPSFCKGWDANSV